MADLAMKRAMTTFMRHRKRIRIRIHPEADVGEDTVADVDVDADVDVGGGDNKIIHPLVHLSIKFIRPFKDILHLHIFGVKFN